MEGDHVWLQASPMKGLMRFIKKGRLIIIFIGPVEIFIGVERYESLGPSILLQ